MTITTTPTIVVSATSTRLMLLQNVGSATVLLANTVDAEGGVELLPGAAFEQPAPCSVAGPLYAHTDEGEGQLQILRVG